MIKKLLLVAAISSTSAVYATGVPVVDGALNIKKDIEWVQTLAQWAEWYTQWEEDVRRWKEQYEGSGMGGINYSAFVAPNKNPDSMEMVDIDLLLDLSKGLVDDELVKYIDTLKDIDEYYEISQAAMDGEYISEDGKIFINHARQKMINIEQLKDKTDARFKSLAKTNADIKAAQTVKAREGLAVKANAEVGYTNIVLAQALTAQMEQQAHEDMRLAKTQIKSAEFTEEYASEIDEIIAAAEKFHDEMDAYAENNND